MSAFHTSKSLFQDDVSLRPLWQHQEQAIDDLRAALTSGSRRPLIQAPTGFGKTLTAAHIIDRALQRGKRVIFTVPALALIDQTLQAFRAEGIRCIGVMQADHHMTDLSQPVQIASVQTLARREIPTADLVIIDEAHRKYDSISQWMKSPSWANIPFVGLSATPWTRGLGKDFDKLIVAATTADLIDKGFLSKFVVYAPTTFDVSKVAVARTGDFDQSELAEAIDKSELVGDVVAEWMARGENRPTLCFGVNRKHAEHMSQRFNEAGFRAEYLDCFTKDYERQEIIGRFNRGDTRILCNVGVLSTGFDSDVRCIIDARPTRSEMLFVQTIGRGLRTAKGKDDLIILDHAGNHLRLGLVTDIHHESLDDGRSRRAEDKDRERKVPLPRLCDDCKAVIPRGATVCSQCGVVIEAKTDVVIRDGNLIKIGSPVAAAPAPSMAERIVFFAELKHIAHERGYSPGWAAHKFKDRFGSWPNGWEYRSAPPRLASLKTKQWVRSRTIAFAKRKAVSNG
jgi:DNA repair protein RadD